LAGKLLKNNYLEEQGGDGRRIYIDCEYEGRLEVMQTYTQQLTFWFYCQRYLVITWFRHTSRSRGWKKDGTLSGSCLIMGLVLAALILLVILPDEEDS
jgi:hypothetical protein